MAVNKDLYIICQNCGHKFKLNENSVKLHSQTFLSLKDRKWLEVTYWSCLRCHHAFLVMIQDTQHRRMLAHLQRHPNDRALTEQIREYQAQLRDRYAEEITAHLNKERTLTNNTNGGNKNA